MENKSPIVQKLKQRLRLVLFDDQSYKELKSMTLTRFQILTRALSVLLLLFSLAAALIAFSPLREYIPGYSPPYLSEDLIRLSLKTDQLLEEIQIKDHKLEILEKVLRGESFEDSSYADSSRIPLVSSEDLKASTNDSVFRQTIEREGRFDVFSETTEPPLELINTAFYAPLKGLISDSFDLQTKHYGVDVLAPENEAIKASLGGTVVFSDWTSETGYSIAIQHDNNIISFYKHNSVLLKKTGESVKAGDVIAIIGNSGEFSSGPHLHFEMWHKGKAINPEHHILF
jgi:murein DD-endopeptidase MepM/ murein hydrolase activator NlpD